MKPKRKRNYLLTREQFLALTMLLLIALTVIVCYFVFT